MTPHAFRNVMLSIEMAWHMDCRAIKRCSFTGLLLLSFCHVFYIIIIIMCGERHVTRK